jgi:hypothetical protein
VKNSDLQNKENINKTTDNNRCVCSCKDVSNNFSTKRIDIQFYHFAQRKDGEEQGSHKRKEAE